MKLSTKIVLDSVVSVEPLINLGDNNIQMGFRINDVGGKTSNEVLSKEAG